MRNIIPSNARALERHWPFDYKPKTGFTLIELSIVLVIIGLLVGGVMVGKDLIESSKLRSTVSQYEKFNTAVATFRLKYNGLAGDIANASQFGFVSAASNTYVIRGNNLLEGSNGAMQSAGPSHENTQFWNHLSVAGLIENTIVSTPAHLAAPVPVEAISTIVPPAKLGNSNFWMAYSLSGQNYYSLLGLIDEIDYNYGMTANKLTPSQAYYLDNKIDDGMPRAGKVIVIYSNNNYLNTLIPATNNTPSASTTCMQGVVGPDTTTYRLSLTNPACGLRFVLPY